MTRIKNLFQTTATSILSMSLLGIVAATPLPAQDSRESPARTGKAGTGCTGGNQALRQCEQRSQCWVSANIWVRQRSRPRCDGHSLRQRSPGR